jgi:catalase
MSGRSRTSSRTRRRSSHLLGVGAKGEFLPAVGDGVPSHDFFRNGKPMPVKVRFANLTELDDAALDVRGCAVMFEGSDGERFDLLMNTGSFCPAFNLPTFAGFVASKFVPEKGSEAIVRSNRVAREGGVAGLRSGPDSYARLYFHSQIVRYWVDINGVRRLVRYRCVPDDLGPESGLPDAAEAEHIWIRERRVGDERASNYLREELRQRVKDGGVRMRIQAQFHRPAGGDSEEWYNPSVDWDEDTHPWQELGTLELREGLPDAETERLCFDPGNHPASLGIPRSASIWDYRSLGDSEARVVRTLQRLRTSMYRRSGLPSFGAVARR